MVATDGHRLAYAPSARRRSRSASRRGCWCRARRSTSSRACSRGGGRGRRLPAGATNHLVFAVGGRTLASKMIEGQFPAFEKVIAVTGDKKVDARRARRCRRAIRRVSLLSSERSRAVQARPRRRAARAQRLLARAGRGARVAAASSTRASAVEIGFNAQYLLDFLGVGRHRAGGARAQGRREPGPPAAGGRGRRRLPLRRDADAALEREVSVGLGARGSESATCGTSARRRVELAPGLNVFVGRNAQGKTIAARGRRPPRARPLLPHRATRRSLIRRGAEARCAAAARATATAASRRSRSSSSRGRRAFRVDGRDVRPREYHGRLDVVVYSTERLRVVRGPMRERRQFLDRAARRRSGPRTAQTLRDFERVLAPAQRRARGRARATSRPGTSASSTCGARLRAPPRGLRRAAAARRSREGFRPARRALRRCASRPAPAGARRSAARRSPSELAAPRAARAARRAAASSGPHRDAVAPRRRRRGRRRRAPRPARRAACSWR